MSSKKRVCVVGAGVSGLVTIKECKNVGLDPVCYELHSDLGGIWTLDREDKSHNCPWTWDALMTNTSKYVMTFSDFQPWPDTPQYMTRRALSEYYVSYARHFELTEHIRYNTRVLRVRKTADHSQTGRWEVLTCSTAEFRGGDKRAGLVPSQEELDRCNREVFDVVLVCSGFFKIPIYPDVPGLDTFPGLVQHSFDYKSGRPFQDKKVLVVGNSFSAGDIAVDISLNTGQAVEVSTGQGTWIWPRLLPGGQSGDKGVSRKALYTWSPEKLNDLQMAACQARLDHIKAGINPPLPPMKAPYFMGDDIYLKIMTDRVRLRDQLVRLNGTTAEFKNGSSCSDLDAVVLATGYRMDASFVEVEVLQEDGRVELYNMMLPLREKHHTLAFVGFLAGDGPVAPPTELQARYMAGLITGRIQPPSRAAMAANVQLLASLSLERRGKYSYHLPSFLMGDLIARDVGVYPTFWRVFLRDPVLAWRVWTGPFFSAHFRLLGPDSDWDTARAVCYRALQVLDGTPSPRRSVKVRRDDVMSARRGKLLKLAGGVALLAVLAYVGKSRGWLEGWKPCS